MEILNNVNLYLDDLEIVDILKTIPAMDELQGKTIIKYLDENSVRKNIGLTFMYNQEVYTLLKFDKDLYSDAGLILQVSEPIYSKNQIMLLDIYRHQGGSLSKDVIERLIAQLEIFQVFGETARYFF